VSKLREVPSTKFDDLTYLVRPGAEFTEPPWALQRIHRAAAYVGWRLKQSRVGVKAEQARQEEVMKKPLRLLFGSGAIAGVIRKGPRGSRVSVTQAKSRIPDDPLGFLTWLGSDASSVISRMEIDPLIFAHPKVAQFLIRDVQQRLGTKVEFPAKLVVDHDRLGEVLAERGVDPSEINQFFTEVDRGEPTVYAEYAT
jgi:hypothetical protein